MRNVLLKAMLRVIELGIFSSEIFSFEVIIVLVWKAGTFSWNQNILFRIHKNRARKREGE